MSKPLSLKKGNRYKFKVSNIKEKINGYITIGFTGTNRCTAWCVEYEDYIKCDAGDYIIATVKDFDYNEFEDIIIIDLTDIEYL